MSAKQEGIITALKFSAPPLESRAIYHSVGRTPMDMPIVSAIGYSQAEGNLQVALTGVGEIPVLIKSADELANLNPEGDFRGSSDYRKHLTSVLYSRILEELQS